jgi:hypothetical protein
MIKCLRDVPFAIAAVCLFSCYFLGPVMLLAGICQYYGVPCEVLERANVTSIVPSPEGIDLCVASFVYSPAALPGSLVTPCPSSLDAHGNVAVCYPVRDPGRYQAALQASSLDVAPHSIAIFLLDYGMIMTGVALGSFLIVVFFGGPSPISRECPPPA